MISNLNSFSTDIYCWCTLFSLSFGFARAAAVCLLEQSSHRSDRIWVEFISRIKKWTVIECDSHRHKSIVIVAWCWVSREVENESLHILSTLSLSVLIWNSRVERLFSFQFFCTKCAMHNVIAGRGKKTTRKFENIVNFHYYILISSCKSPQLSAPKWEFQLTLYSFTFFCCCWSNIDCAVRCALQSSYSKFFLLMTNFHKNIKRKKIESSRYCRATIGAVEENVFHDIDDVTKRANQHRRRVARECCLGKKEKLENGKNRFLSSLLCCVCRLTPLSIFPMLLILRRPPSLHSSSASHEYLFFCDVDVSLSLLLSEKKLYKTISDQLLVTFFLASLKLSTVCLNFSSYFAWLPYFMLYLNFARVSACM